MSYTWTDGEVITAEHLNETGKILKIKTIDMAKISFSISSDSQTSTGTGGIFFGNKTFKQLIGDNIIIGFRLENSGTPNTQNAENWFLYPEDFKAGIYTILTQQSSEEIQDKTGFTITLYCKNKASVPGNYDALVKAICIEQ